MIGIDILIFSVAGISFLCAYWSGFTAEMTKIGAVVLSSVIGFWLWPFTSEFWQSLFANESVARFVGIAGMSSLLFILFRAAASKLQHWVRGGALKHIDSVLGGAFGFIRGFVCIVAVATGALIANPAKVEALADNSLFMPRVIKTATLVKEYVTDLTLKDLKKSREEMADQMEESQERVEHIVEKIEKKVD